MALKIVSAAEPMRVSESQVIALQQLEQYRMACMAAENADDLNDLREQLQTGHLYLKEMRQALDLAFKGLSPVVCFEQGKFIDHDVVDDACINHQQEALA